VNDISGIEYHITDAMFHHRHFVVHAIFHFATAPLLYLRLFGGDFAMMKSDIICNAQKTFLSRRPDIVDARASARFYALFSGSRCSSCLAALMPR